MSDELVASIKATVGPKGWIADRSGMARFLQEERGLFRGAAQLVVQPGTVGELSEVVRLCHAAGQPIVPQGGNTGLCGGGVPNETGREIVVSLARLNRVRGIDPLNYTITVEAGCILSAIQSAAEAADRLFPLSLAAEGSCQIGGNLSTNAGGIQVLRYGNARDLVLGLEVVLPDGRVWDGLRSLRKDNTGYDLKQLFVGAEGTLGIISAAVLKLFPRPRAVETALAAVRGPQAAIELLARCRAGSGDCVTAFELLPRIGIEFVLRHMPGSVDPFATPQPWQVLIDFSSGESGGAVRNALETILERALEEGLVLDAVVASSAQQAKQLWKLREAMSESQKHEGGSIKHDVSVPVSRVAEFIEAASRAVHAEMPDLRIVAFGHVGDGNVHYNLSQPVGADKAAFLSHWGKFNRIVHDIVVSMGGSISAEHGIGQLKRDELAHYKAPLELELMRKVKAALDPRGIMNPGKVI
jgi:FAD/FMN-containing dehydrogenase